MIALEPGQQWLAQFRLLKELVPKSEKRPNIWLAEKHGAGDKVVLKFLRPGPPSPLLVRRLADWRATRLPQFMPLLGVHTAGDQMALELPFVADDNAMLRGASYTKWSVWLEQVVDTLQALHRDNFIHGDIKLSNIRRDAHGGPVLADPWLPGDGKSPYTASPERLSGGPISIQDDLYSLGALIHELSTGYPPRYPGLDPAKPAKPRFEMPPEALEAMTALLQAAPARRPSLADVLATLSPLNLTHPHEGESSTPKPAAPPRVAMTAAPPPARVVPARPAGPATAAASALLSALPAASRAPTAQQRAVAAMVVSPLPAPASIAPARQQASAANDAAPAFSAAPLEIRPPVDMHFEPVPLQVGSPTWVRPASAAGISANSASPFQSRASVWRWPVLLLLLGGAVAAFVWLPDEIRQSAVQQVTAMAARSGLMPAASPPPPPADLRSLAEQKLQAEQSRDRAAAMQTSLRDNGAAARNVASFVAGSEAHQRGLSAFDQRDFKTADADFNTAIQAFESTRLLLPQLHEQALAAGDAALGQCLREQALNEYRYALALSPQDARAKEGIVRAQVCEQVFAHIGAGAKAEQDGDAATARSEYQAAVQLDPKSTPALQALGALSGQVNELQFSRLIAAALEALRKQRYSAAATAIAAAETLRPNSPEVQRLTEQLGEVRSTERLQALKAEAADDEQAEQWNEALDAYRAMLSVDGTLVLALQGAQRSQDRMTLDAELAGYIDHSERLSAEEVRGAAAAVLARAQALPVRGARLDRQISRIQILLSQFDSLVQLSLRSDGLTDITIYRVGGLGKLTQRSVSLKPGKYTFVGTRLGYRDVRRELEVIPGQADAALEIRCEEQI